MIQIKSRARLRLRDIVRADTILNMLLARPLRRFVACASAALFLACQGMAIAGVQAPASAQAGTEAPMAPCHDAGGEAGKGTGSCPAQCEFQNASSTPAKLVYATADQPAITVDFASAAASPRAVPLSAPPLARIEPPPLRILNCCLRN